MLEFLRKHQYGLMLFVAIVVIIAFTFFGNPNDGKGGRVTEFKLGGKSYGTAELQKLFGQFQLAAGFTPLGMEPMVTALTSEAMAAGALRNPQSFIYNLSIFRNHVADLGISASDEEVLDAIRNSPAFRTAPSGYDPAKYSNLLDITLPRLGLAEEDFLQLIGDNICFEKFQDLLAAGVSASPLAVDANYAANSQKVVAYVIAETADKAKESITITPEAIEAEFKSLQEKGEAPQSPPKRSVEYAFFEDPTYVDPEIAAKAAAVKRAEDAVTRANTEAETAAKGAADAKAAADALDDTDPKAKADAVAGASAKAALSDAAAQRATAASEALAKAKAEAPPEPPKEFTLEERKRLNGLLTETIQTFLDEARLKNADFPALAKALADKSADSEISAQYHKLEPFDASDAPEGLKDKRNVLRGIFQSTTPNTLLSPPPRDPSGVWVVNILEIIEPKDRTLEESTEGITEYLTGEKVKENIQEKLSKAATELAENTKDGAAFKAAAEAAGYKVERVAYDGRPMPVEGVDLGMLMEAVRKTAPGQISEALSDQRAGGLVAYVAEKSTSGDEEAAKRSKEAISRQLLQGSRFQPGYQTWLFQAWLQKARTEAAPEPVQLNRLTEIAR